MINEDTHAVNEEALHNKHITIKTVRPYLQGKLDHLDDETKEKVIAVMEKYRSIWAVSDLSWRMLNIGWVHLPLNCLHITSTHQILIVCSDLTNLQLS